MKSGFTLIEFMVVLLVSAMLMTFLFRNMTLITKTGDQIDSVIRIDTAIAIVQNQLEKDINGAFIPLQAQDPDYLKREQEQAKASQEPKQPDAAAKKNEELAKKDEPKKKKPLTKIFNSTYKGEQFESLTFISNNPIRVYEKAGIASPRIVRIMYRVIPDKKNSQLFRLMRQESTNLDIDIFTSGQPQTIRQFELARGIKKMTVEYIIPTWQEIKQEGKDGKTTFSITGFSTLTQWPNSEKELKKDEKPLLLPAAVKVTLSMLDTKTNAEYTFAFDFPVAGFEYYFNEYLQLLKKPEKVAFIKESLDKLSERIGKNMRGRPA